MTSEGSRLFEYDEQNRLTKVTQMSDSSLIASFEYDADGRRTSKTTPTETIEYFYDGDSTRVLYETDGNGNLLVRYIFDQRDQLVAMVRGGETYFYHYNYRGDVVALTDSTGAVVAEYDYDSYGQPVETGLEGTLENTIRYASYRWDAEIGMYYLNARYYWPAVGRFITRDAFHGFEDEPASLNQYNYAQSNPVMYVDPTGYSGVPNWALAAVINVGLAVYTGGMAVLSVSKIRSLLRKHRTNITRVVERKIMRYVGTTAGALASTAINIALTVKGSSIGGIIVYVIDNYIDPRLGFKKNNGRSFG